MDGRTRWGIAVTAAVAAGILALAACQGGARTGGSLAPVGEARMDQFHKSCLAAGGEYLPTGSRTYSCTGVPKDAGKACSRKIDCTGACLARSRSCAPVVPLFGCNQVLDEAGAEVTECLN